MQVNSLIYGDALEILPTLPDDSIDLILTDPPFNISREVVIHRRQNPQKYKFVGKDISLDFGEWDKQWESDEEYIEWCYKWLRECFRILRKGGHFVSFIDKFKVSYFVDFARRNGMIPRQCLFWLKNNPVPRARRNNFMEALEQCVWFTKETTSREFATFNYQLGQSPNYFVHCIVGHTTKSDGERVHTTQKPIAFCEWLISYLSNEGDVVLDPFMGSGATCIAALKLDRKYIGIEIDKKYFEQAKERIRKIEIQPKLPMDVGVSIQPRQFEFENE